MRPSFASPVFALLLLTGLAACSPEPPAGEDVHSIQDREWLLREIDGAPVTADLDAALLFAADGGVAGRTGCNFLSGQTAFKGDSLEFGPVITTKRACPPAVMDQESRFLDALGRTERWRLDDDRLSLLDGTGAALLRFSAAD